MRASERSAPPAARARTRAVWPLVLLALGLASVAPFALGDPAKAAGRIAAPTVESHVRTLAAPELQGRGSPSAGQARAAAYISERFTAAGLEPAPDADEVWKELGEGERGEAERYLRPFRLRLPAPVADGCSLELAHEDRTRSFALHADFVPAPLCTGRAEGPLVFAGFGISSKDHHYDDLAKLRLEGAIALIFEGEPRHKQRFDGPEHTLEASLWRKLERLAERKVAGVIVARRPPEGAARDAEVPLDFRHDYATFPGEREPLPPRNRPVVLEVGLDTASLLLGTDARALAERMDRTLSSGRVETRGRTVRMSSAIEQRQVRLDNVLGIVPGRDPERAKEYVLLGAHYDHIGIDARGRVGAGADDNASGVSALLSIADALAATPPRRSTILVAFCAEERGLVGSKELAARLPVPKESIVAMLNMDMLGRGDADEVAVIGLEQNPALQPVLERAQRIARSGVKKVQTRGGEELWRRSDHYSFHEIGIPVLFFFEGLPISRNQDYHTWRDLPERLDAEKIARTARLVFNTLWILAEDDGRPGPPKG